MKRENGEEQKIRVMTVFYERLTPDEEEALCDAVESVICPDNSDESEHDCRLHTITWKDVVEPEG